MPIAEQSEKPSKEGVEGGRRREASGLKEAEKQRERVGGSPVEEQQHLPHRQAEPGKGKAKAC